MIKGRHVLSTGVATLVSGGLGLLLAFVAARLLTPVENGYYAQYLLVMSGVFIVLNFGIGPASTYHLASGRWGLPEMTRLNVRFTGIVGLLVLIVGLALAVTPAGVGLERTFKAPAPVLYAGLASGVLLIGVTQATAVLMGCHRYDRANIVNVLRSGLPLPFVLGAGFAVGGEMAVIGAQTIALAGVLAVALALLPGAPTRADGTRGAGRIHALLRYGGLAYLSNLLHFTAMRGLLLFVSFHAAPEQVGYFTLALLLLEALLLLPSTIGQLALSQSNSPMFDHDQIETMLRVNIYIGLALSVGIVFAAEPLAAWLLGPAYASAGTALANLAPSVVLLTIPRILSQVLSGQGRPGYPLAAAVASAAVSIVLAVWWIPGHGLVAAAWITNIVAAVTAVVVLVGYCRVQGGRVLSVLTPQLCDFTLVGQIRRGWRGSQA
ncbi:MAG: lipopolysaccharide biosynthesis protein [Nitrospirae bacterium]|nr:lipopolysaccharide biosynthesis protein [Nitrospirota bacterium]